MTDTDPYSFANIKKLVFPYLEPALKKVLDEINHNQEISRYQLKLAKKKIYDRCEQRFIEKEKLRAELGDQYSSSDSEEEIDYDFLGVTKPHLRQIIRSKLHNSKFSHSLLENSEKQQLAKQQQQAPKAQPQPLPAATPAESSPASKNETEVVPQIDRSGPLVEIKENQEQDQEKYQNISKFNPVLFVAEYMERSYHQKIAKADSQRI